MRARILAVTWGAFAVLIAFGVNGSPMPALANFWSGQPYHGYVLDRLDTYARKKLGPASTSLDQLLLSTPQDLRSDDYMVRFPLALSQLAHRPKFPVLNTNYWTGRNMLAFPQYDVPVWHISALARPASWGYFLFGAQRGVAWEWWFQIFACFTTLYLLLEVIIGPGKLAAFGAIWFCLSAENVAFGYWPTYATFFIALATLSAYRLLQTSNPRLRILCAVLLGFSVAGFVMVMYPPWQAPLGYLFLVILAGLIVRDKLYRQRSRGIATTAAALGIAALIASVIVGTYLGSCWDALKLMAATDFPGHRRLAGGSFHVWGLFAGAYNLLTTYTGYDLTAGGVRVGIDQTEASSFYLLFPALLAPLAFSRTWRRRFGAIGWALLAYTSVIVVFMRFGLPNWLLHITLLDRVPSPRAILPVGISSIILCLIGLQCAEGDKQPDKAFERGDLISSTSSGRTRTLWSMAPPVMSAAIMAALIGYSGLRLAAGNNGIPEGQMILFAGLLGGYAAYCLVSGLKAQFCAIVMVCVVATASVYNPLSTGLDYIYKSEMAEQIERLDRQSPRALWLCYDKGYLAYGGVLVTTLGGRAITGIQWPPPLDFWHSLDPQHRYEGLYNSYAHVSLRYTDDESVSIAKPLPLVLNLTIRPDNAVLKAMGAKYILALSGSASEINTARFPLVYKSPSGLFSIFEIP